MSGAIFAAAAAVASHVGTKAAKTTGKQTDVLHKVISGTMSIQMTGQAFAQKRVSADKLNLRKSQGDAVQVNQDIQKLISSILSATADDMSTLHTALTLQMAQPGAFPTIPIPDKKGKVSRDADVKLELANAMLNAAKEPATGEGLERCNENKGLIAKNIFRQAGSVMLDYASNLIHSGILVVTQALKYLIHVTDLDILADTISTHANAVMVGIQEAVLLIAKKLTISVGGKLKLVLQDDAEVHATKALLAQVLGNFELTAQQIKLAAAAGINLETTQAMTFKALTLSLEASTAVTIKAGGLALSMSAGQFAVGVDPTVLTPPVVVPTPVPVPTALGIKPVSSGTMKAAVTTTANIGQNSGPAHVG